jgi:acylphosphatase
MSDRLGVHIRVYGRVQGVYYRNFTRRNALRLNLTGWVRNRPDGTVEATAAGEQKQLLEFVAALEQGPPKARVDNIEVAWQKSTSAYSDFQIMV